MSKRTINFWIIAVVGTLAFGWMFAELFRVLWEIRDSGVSKVALDGVVQHKVGELMVGIPFVAVLALQNVWPMERVRTLLRRTAIVMIAGGLLNALAWYSLRNQVAADEFLRIWCLIIFVFGSTAYWLLMWMLTRAAITRSPIMKNS